LLLLLLLLLLLTEWSERGAAGQETAPSSAQHDVSRKLCWLAASEAQASTPNNTTHAGT